MDGSVRLYARSNKGDSKRAAAFYLKIPPHFFYVLFIGNAEFLYALSFFSKDHPMGRNLKY